MTRTLNDGTQVPETGFGTASLTGEQAVGEFASALDAGYRYLDSAVNYRNEAEVGEALRRSGLPREEVRLATKIPGRFHAYELALKSLADSAEAFGVERIDVALIHWPNPITGLYPEAWRALVRAQQDGLVETIGVSNFTEEHLTRIIDDTGVVPALNQIELHPSLPQDAMRAVHARLGVLTQSWSPFGERAALLAQPPIADAAAAHGTTPGQVVLRWHLQLDAMPLPRSSNPERQRVNLALDGFALSEDEMAAIGGLVHDDARLFGADPDTHEEM